MGESFDHGPAGWIRQSREGRIQFIHNHMVVDYPPMSSVDFGVPVGKGSAGPETRGPRYQTAERAYLMVR